MEKYFHTFRTAFDSEMMKERRVVYMSAEAGPEPKKPPEAKKDGTEQPAANPDKVQTAQEKYEKERDDLLTTARKIADDPASTPVMKEAARKAMRAIAEQAEKPRSLDDKQILEFRGRINEILYAPKIKEYEAKRDVLRKQADEKYKSNFNDVETFISKVLNSPAYKNLSARGKDNIAKIQVLWRGKLNEAIAKNLPYVYGAEGLPKTFEIKPESFDGPNNKLSEESAKINSDDAEIKRALDDVASEYKMSARVAALEDIAAGPGVSREDLQTNIDVYLTEVILQTNETIDNNLPINGKNKKENKKNEAARKEAKDRVSLFGEDAKQQITIIGYNESDAGKRAVVLAWFRDRINSLAADPANPNPKIEYDASLYLAKANKMDTTDAGKRFLGTLGITPQEKKPESEVKPAEPETKPAETAPTEAEKQPAQAEDPAWTEAKMAPSEYQIPIFEIERNADTPQGAKFNMRISRTDYPMTFFKYQGEYILQMPGGFLKFNSKEEVKTQLKEGILTQRIMFQILKNKDVYKSFEGITGEVKDLSASQNDKMQVSFDLDWKGLAHAKGNAHVTVEVNPHGELEYKVVRHFVGINGEGERVGHAGSFRDLMLQMAHLKDWSENQKYLKGDIERQRESNYKEMTNPGNYYSRAAEIGRPVYFEVIKANNAVRAYLDWGGGTQMANSPNPFMQITLKPDGTFELYLVHKEMQIAKETNFPTMQELFDHVAKCRTSVLGAVPKSLKPALAAGTAYGEKEAPRLHLPDSAGNAKEQKPNPTMVVADTDPLNKSGKMTLVGAEPAAEKAGEEKSKKEEPKKPAETEAEKPNKYAEQVKEAKTLLEFKFALYDAYYAQEDRKPEFQKAVGAKLERAKNLMENLDVPENLQDESNKDIQTLNDFVKKLKEGKVDKDTIHRFVMDNMTRRPETKKAA